jgi:NlpC/P60 family putative phage cell wall peptidase
MTPADPSRVIAAARAWLGTPYRHQASALGAGCDCLGLARGVWRALHGAEPVAVPPYTRDWGEAGAREVLAGAARGFLIEIAVGDAGPGALILFRMARHAPAKHCGILNQLAAELQAALLGELLGPRAVGGDDLAELVRRDGGVVLGDVGTEDE